jgi:hypothetical protein
MPGTQGRYLFRIVPILSGTAVLLGGLIYVFLRPAEPVFIKWVRVAGLESLIDLLRSLPSDAGTALPRWIVYSLPGALWAFAYSVIITGIWARSNSSAKYFWLSTIPILVLGIEILQVPGVFPGTFCVQDLTLAILGSGAGTITMILSQKPSYHESKNI